MDLPFTPLLLVALLAVAAWWAWNNVFCKVPLAALGAERVLHALRFENPDYRAAVLSRGWMTRREWRALNQKQLAQVRAELQRRGLPCGKNGSGHA